MSTRRNIVVPVVVWCLVEYRYVSPTGVAFSRSFPAARLTKKHHRSIEGVDNTLRERTLGKYPYNHCTVVFLYITYKIKQLL